MKTSIGHHTITIFLQIDGKEAKELYFDFCNYRDTTGKIKMYVPTGDKNWTYATGDHFRTIKKTPKVWRINYIDDRKGISWTLRFYNHSGKFKTYLVEAKINPKVFVGIKDYIRASDSRYLLEVERKFNEEASLISPLLGQFFLYTPKRIDFCINFDLRELGIFCTPEQMMWLIKRGDYPSNFKEFQYYDKISHRKKTFKYSFYLWSGTVNINCYYKYFQLKAQFPDCPNIDDALHIIRFEVQCKYRKTRAMLLSEKARMKEEEKLFGGHRSIDDPVRIIHRMLSDMTAEKIITQYFNQIIKPGDYYTLAEAKEIIEDENFTLRKEDDIIRTLDEINKMGIARFRQQLHPSSVNIFYKVLNALAELNINPVTIPKSFKEKHIQNLLSAFNKLRDSGELADSFNDPYEPLEEPYELSISQTDVANLLDDEDGDN